MKNSYEVRFWNAANENIMVGGCYYHSFDSFADAWDAANAFLNNAYKKGAVEVSINDACYPIEED